MTRAKFVYVLEDPRDGEIRYVGVTENPKARYGHHCRLSENIGKRAHRARWICSLLELGLKPEMVLLERADDWDEAERRWIRNLRAIGCHLVNGNDGGKTLDHAKRAKASGKWAGRHTPMQRILLRLRLDERQGFLPEGRTNEVARAFEEAYRREGREAAKARINAGLVARYPWMKAA